MTKQASVFKVTRTLNQLVMASVLVAGIPGSVFANDVTHLIRNALNDENRDLAAELVIQQPTPEELPIDIRLRVIGQLLGALNSQSSPESSHTRFLETIRKLDPNNEIVSLEDLDEASSKTTDESESSQEESKLLSLLEPGRETEVISYLKANQNLALSEQSKKRAIDYILDYVRPLPASNAEANRDGYRALALLEPNNQTYSDKARRYADAALAQRASIVRRMKANRDDFKEITWYEHPSVPRYADTRSYVSLYLGRRDSGALLPRFVVHYTSDSWLFVSSVQFKIDGDVVHVAGLDKWKRDNDSEIWEWTDAYLTDELRSLAIRIAESQKTLVRFNGRQYYDDFIVSGRDKQAIRDMLLLEEVLKEEDSS